MAPANTEQELKVNKVEEQFQMIVACQWPFKFKIAKILNILTEADFCQELEKIHRLVQTKTIIYTRLQGHPLRNKVIRILALISIKSILLKRAMNQSRALVTLRDVIRTFALAKTERTAVPTSAPLVKLKAQLLRVKQLGSQQLEWMIRFYRREIS